ncbi:MAG: hypothetical protein Q7R69_01270 [bacterium]|nr:hypothetical protein [bacterium]
MKKYHLLLVTLVLITPVFYSQAQTVDILWQGQTYTSPFYKGKSLWSSQSRITFLAIPHGTGTGNPASLIYKWSKNGTVLGNINGVGKNTMVYTDLILSKPQTVKIDVLSPDEGLLASASVAVTPISPILAIYENNPLYGFMFHKETSGTHELQNKEATFTAFPLFFSVSNRMDSGLKYEWRTNDGGVETSNSVTYRVPDDTPGTSAVAVEVSNINKIMQSSNKSFLIQFGKQ